MRPAMQGRVTTAYRIEPCPVCAASDAHQVASGVELAREHAELRRLRSRQPGNAVHDVTEFTQRPPLQLVRCRQCGLLYRNPAESHVAELYEEEETPLPALATLHDLQLPAFRPLAARLTQLLDGTAGNVLEIGSYSGAFLRAAADDGWDAEGVDVNGNVVRFLRDRGYRVEQGGIEDVAPGRMYDAVVFWNCYDQLPDPYAAATLAHELLHARGILGLRVPNGEFYAALRSLLRGPLRAPARSLLAQHNFLGFPYRYGFTRSSLARLLDDTGFEVVSVGGAAVLPADARVRPVRARMLDAAARVLRPIAGEPWLELYAVRR